MKINGNNFHGLRGSNFYKIVSWGRIIGALPAILALISRAQPPTVDSFDPKADSAVYAIAIQSDNRIILGGSFTDLADTARGHMGRVDASGALDGSFDPQAGGTGSDVYSFAIQTDGRILVGGNFGGLAGRILPGGLGRLLPSGAIDPDFKGTANFDVRCLTLQPNAQILVGGMFNRLDDQITTAFGRLNQDGSLDTNFNTIASHANTVALQSDGRSIVGFQDLGAVRRYNLDGSGSFTVTAESGEVDCLTLQPDGKILIAGSFTCVAGQPRNRIARLNPDGTLDASFNPGADYYVYSLGLQANGKILVGGLFWSLAGKTCYYVGRLNPDGTFDTTFNPEPPNEGVYSLALQADGKILVGGGFTTLGGQNRSMLGRLNNTEPATQSLTFDWRTITWFRGGSSPEVWRTFFETSTNGIDWTNLGEGVRVDGGWQNTPANFPSNATIRARGYVSGGFRNGSNWYVETSVSTRAFPPQLLAASVKYLYGQGFEFRIAGEPGSTFVIEASGDLVGWLPLGTITNSSAGDVLYGDPLTSVPQRFYRVRYQ